MPIKLINPFQKNQELVAGEEGLAALSGQTVFPFVKGAYRVLETESNYTENFGFQWNKFSKTQIDTEYETFQISKTRFFAETNWDKEDLTGKNVLEVGSGAGRFSQVVLRNTNANLYSVDYSNAVEANFKTNGQQFASRFTLFQASIYDMPFVPQQFDKVFCMGVLQHTPDVEQSVKALIEMAKPGAEVVVDFYVINGWWTKVCAKYMLRPVTKKWSNEKLLAKIENNIDWMIRLYRFLYKIKLGVLTRFIPIVDIYGTLPYKNLNEKELREWCILDTFDMFSPEYDQPQRANTVVGWFKKYGISNAKAEYVKFDNTYATVVKGTKDRG